MWAPPPFSVLCLKMFSNVNFLFLWQPAWLKFGSSRHNFGNWNKFNGKNEERFQWGKNLKSGRQAQAVQPGLSNAISGFKDSATELLALFSADKTLAAAGEELLISESGEGVWGFCLNCWWARHTQWEKQPCTSNPKSNDPSHETLLQGQINWGM